MNRSEAGGFTFESVPWGDLRAVDLRRRMDVEMIARYTAPPVREMNGDAVDQALAVDPQDILATVLVLGADEVPIGHGALRLLRDDWEVKRVVVDGDQRGRGVGRGLMTELERIARAGQARRLILQTGDRQPEAVALYERLGYTPIPIYEPYVEAIPFSFCFEKLLG